MSHEKAREDEMTSYFSKKFFPAVPVYVFGRSYAAEPKCKPEQTLYDNWLEHSPFHPHPGGIGPFLPDAFSLGVFKLQMIFQARDIQQARIHLGRTPQFCLQWN